MAIANALNFDSTTTIAGNITGNAGTVTTNANLTGPVYSTGNATSITNNSLTYANIQQVGALKLLGNTTGAVSNITEFSLLPLNMGGTNSNLTASAGALTYSDASSLQLLSAPSLGNRMLLSGSASSPPVWTSFSFPSAVQNGKLLKGQGNVLYTTVNYVDSYNQYDIPYASTANNITAFPTVASSVLTTGSNGAQTYIPLTNGQIIIGSTGGNPTGATLTAGANVTITNSAGSITIAATGGASGGVTTISNTTGADVNLTTADFGKTFQILPSAGMNFNINLPATPTMNGVLNFYVNSSTTNYIQVTIQPTTTGQKINSFYTKCIIGPGEAATLVADGANYQITSQKLIDINSSVTLSAASITIPFNTNNYIIPFDTLNYDLTSSYDTTNHWYFPRYYGLYRFITKITAGFPVITVAPCAIVDASSVSTYLDQYSIYYPASMFPSYSLVSTLISMDGSTNKTQFVLTNTATTGTQRVYGVGSVAPTRFQIQRITNLVS